jgi:hypothetical protein
MQRRGELSKAMMDRDWPHQVALLSPRVAARFKEIQASARRLSAGERTHSSGEPSACPSSSVFLRDGLTAWPLLLAELDSYKPGDFRKSA